MPHCKPKVIDFGKPEMVTFWLVSFTALSIRASNLEKLACTISSSFKKTFEKIYAIIVLENVFRMTVCVTVLHHCVK